MVEGRYPAGDEDVAGVNEERVPVHTATIRLREGPIRPDAAPTTASTHGGAGQLRLSSPPPTVADSSGTPLEAPGHGSAIALEKTLEIGPGTYQARSCGPGLTCGFLSGGGRI